MMKDNTQQTTVPASWSKVIAILGVLLLLAGVYFTVMYKKQAEEPPVAKTNADSLLRLQNIADSLDKLPPQFEIGYGIIELSRYKLMQADKNKNDTDLMAFSVLPNDVAKRIETGLPLLHPDYGKMKSRDPFLTDFFPVYKSRQIRLRETGVGCLIIKQIGKGKADSVQLDLSKVILQGPVSMYDATDIGTDYTTSSILTSNNKITKETSLLGLMNTGNSILIPLYITNLFERTDGGSDPSGWQVTSYTTYVPSALSYITNNRKNTIRLNKVLARPIDIR